MKAKTVMTFCAAIVLSIVSLNSIAFTSCSTDSMGKIICYDTSNGTSAIGSRDGNGNVTLRDNSGNISQGRADANGNTSWSSSNGDTSLCNRDSTTGDTTCRGSQGNNTARCVTDAFGNTTCR